MGRQRKYVSLEEANRERNAKRRQQRANASANHSSGKYEGVYAMVMNAHSICQPCMMRTLRYIHPCINYPAVFSKGCSFLIILLF